MTFGPAHRLMTAASLALALGLTGCAQSPFAGAPLPMEAEEDGFDALAKPVNMEAVALAKSWARDADQVGVMINRSPKGVQDTATFVFASKGKRERMLLVIAAKGGVTAQEIALSWPTPRRSRSSRAGSSTPRSSSSWPRPPASRAPRTWW